MGTKCSINNSEHDKRIVVADNTVNLILDGKLGCV